MAPFDRALDAAIPPIALISGIGLLILSLVSRYNHALDRIRVLIDRRGQREVGSIYVLHRRCRVLRTGLLALSTSACTSGLLVVASVIEALFEVSIEPLRVLLLLASVLAICLGCVIFALDIVLSLRALEIDMRD